jgi:hypothetical protein
MYVHIYMYKLYSIHVNDLLLCPKSLMQFSSSACTQLWSGDLLSPGGSAHLPCLNPRGGGFRCTLLILLHRNAQGPHVPVVRSSPFLVPFLSMWFLPKPWDTVFLQECKAVLRSLYCMCARHSSFLLPQDRKVHVKWDN